MFKNMVTALLLLSFTAGAYAQAGQAKSATQRVDNFYVNQRAKTVGFRLPPNTQLNDVIYMTKENSVVVRKADVIKEILSAGQYEFSIEGLPAGTYTVLIASNSHIKYSFTFMSTAQVQTAAVRAVPNISKEPNAAATMAFATTVLSFNPQQKEFAVSSDIPFREGSKIEVFDAQGALLASREVTIDMLKAKRFPIIVEQLKPGAYYVSVDDVRFGSVTYSE
jgi:hypothetical protein